MIFKILLNLHASHIRITTHEILKCKSTYIYPEKQTCLLTPRSVTKSHMLHFLIIFHSSQVKFPSNNFLPYLTM